MSDVTKTNIYRVELFRAPELGLLGYVDADQVSFYRSPTKRHTERSSSRWARSPRFPRWTFCTIRPAEPEPRQGPGGRRVRGIVIASTGAGTMSAAEREALSPLLRLPADARPVVVRSNRTGNGRVIGRDDYDKLEMIQPTT